MRYRSTRPLLALALSTLALILWGSTAAPPAPRSLVQAHRAPSALAGAGTPTPTPPVLPTCGWAVVPSVNVGPYSNQPLAVAMAAPNVGWLVGYYFNGGNTTQSLIEYWDGTAWYDFPGPNPGFDENRLTAVTTVSPNEAWAVGYAVSGNLYHMLIAHWTGGNWIEVPTPNLGYSFLYGVTAISATDVWAVGQFQPNQITDRKPLILHWDGTQWTIVPNPDPGEGSELHSVAAVAANDVWAVGFQSSSALLEHWDGTQWQLAAAPSVVYDQLMSVSMLSATEGWAVGDQIFSAGRTQPLTLHWDGIAWSRIPTLTHPVSDRITGVAALAPNDVWMIGGTSDATGFHTLFGHWDGTQWLEVPPPSSGNTILLGATAQGPDLWAVGGTYPPSARAETLTVRYHTPCIAPTPGPASPTPTATPSPEPATLTRTPTVIPATPVPSRTPGPPAGSVTPTASPIGPPLGSATPTRTALATACTTEFVDVPPGSTFYTYIRCLACRGIVSGYPCGGPGEPCPGPYYRPGNNVTRGQTAKIVAAAAAYTDPVSSTQQTFADVAPGSTFWLWIERLASRSLVGGYPCGGPFEPCLAPTNRPYFRPMSNVTRGQLAKIVAGAAGWTETPTAQTFADAPPGSTFYLSIERMAARGIISGYPCGGAFEPCVAPANRSYFRPNNNATRGQLSKIAAVTFYPNCPPLAQP